MNAADYRTPRSVIITGGGTGIGRATAHAFADLGDNVLIVGRSAAALEETAADRPTIRTLPIDIVAPHAPQRIVDTAVDCFGVVDVLINNAATAGFDPIGKLGREAVETQVDTNLLAPIFLTQQALEPLAASGGVVINVGSAGAIGLRAMPSNAVYAATKVALDSLTRTWAIELADRGIRVLSIAPGLVNTGVGVRAGMSQAAYDAYLDAMTSQVPRGRIGTPTEVASWIVFLASPDADYANGVLFAVDGGLSVT